MPINEGRNIKRIREILGIKQDALAIDLGLSQQAVSLLEQKETLDVPTLEKVAKALNVPVEAIKNFNEEAAINIIASNNNGKDNSSAVNFQCNINPIDKIVQLHNEKMELYERMLKEKDIMIQKLEMLLEKK